MIRWIGLSFMGLAAVLIFYGIWGGSGSHNEPRNTPPPSPVNEQQILNQVNQNLKQTEFKKQLDQWRVQVDLSQEIPKVGESLWQTPSEVLEKPLFGVDETYQNYLNQWLNLQKSENTQPRADALVWQEAFEQQQRAKFERWAQRHYIWQFRKNAWQAGWYVEVSPTGQVLSKRPLTATEKRRPFSEPEPELLAEE